MKKYLKIILLIWIIVFSMTPFEAFSYDNLSSSRQPDGFRGVYWGVSKNNHQYLFTMYDKVNGIETFNRECEDLTFGSAKLSEITYHFYQDKFYEAVIMLKSRADFQPLFNILIEAFGMPEEESGIYIWENDTVRIRLYPEGASISYLPIFNQIESEYSNN